MILPSKRTQLLPDTRRHFRSWHNWSVRSRLQPIIEVARMLNGRLGNIITYLRRITNATSESINAKSSG
jgi:hypothetical protein